MSRIQYANGYSVLQTKVLEIGDWDMSTATGVGQIDVAHGVAERLDIRRVTVLIRGDTNLLFTLPMYDVNNTGNEAIQVGTTNITIFRGPSGLFDGTDFNATSFNRGWIIVEYVS